MSMTNGAAPQRSGEEAATAAMRLALERRELLKAGQLALGLSRVPGRMETDDAEAYRILHHLMAWYALGKFAPDEVVVCHDELGLQPLREIEKLQEQEVGLFLWREAVMLTRAACKRYLEQSTLEGAPRQLSEWFSTTASDGSQVGSIVAKVPDPQPSNERNPRRNWTRHEIIKALPSLTTANDWSKLSDGERCRRVEQHLNKPSEW